MILLIDNYDSFSYNLYQMVGELEPDIRVIRNDEMTVEEVRALKPDRIILSPGPGRPENAGIIVEAAKTVCKEIPTLGVCLGHQAICQAYGGTITYAERLMHGKQSVATVDPDSPIFRGLPERAGQPDLPGSPGAGAGGPVPLAGSGPGEPSRVPAVHRQNRCRGSHGGTAHRVPHLRPAVPPGVHPDPGGKDHFEEFHHVVIKERRTMIEEAIVKIVDKQDLTYDEAYAVMNEIMSGGTSATQNAAFLAALSTKSAKAETTAEIAGCAAAMREHATALETDYDVLEIVGTGGDRAHSFNISTTSALVAAAGGIKVAKHGNRAASSSSGTADVQEALGVNIAQDPDKCRELLDEVGLCFMFAQKYHTSMKYVGPIRKELGIRTVFNILGPLTNPAKPTYMVLGVYDEYLVQPLAQVLANLGVKRGLVVYGKDRMDEISASSETTVAEVNNGWYKTYTIKPEDFGLVRGTKDELVGGSAEENAVITRDVLSGKEQGTRRNAVLMNAGACFYVSGKAETLADGVKMAAAIIDSGKALETLEQYIDVSNR